MADEPILCFDGDKAGQKAALRAAYLALPHLQTLKSLRPSPSSGRARHDDLARSGGRARSEEVRGGAVVAGLADVIWFRARSQGGSYATPGGRGARRWKARQRAFQRIRDEGLRALLSLRIRKKKRRLHVHWRRMAAGKLWAAGGNFGSESGRRFSSALASCHAGRRGDSSPAATGLQVSAGTRPSTAVRTGASPSLA